MLERRGPIEGGSAPIGKVPPDLECLLSCGVCFGRLLSKELNNGKGEEVLNTPSLPRWDHRSDFYRELLVDNISGLTDRGVRLDGWGPLEEHDTRWSRSSGRFD